MHWTSNNHCMCLNYVLKELSTYGGVRVYWFSAWAALMLFTAVCGSWWMLRCLSPSAVSRGKTSHNFRKHSLSVIAAFLQPALPFLVPSALHHCAVSHSVKQCSGYFTSQTGFNLNHEEAGNPHNCWPGFVGDSNGARWQANKNKPSI